MNRIKGTLNRYATSWAMGKIKFKEVVDKMALNYALTQKEL